MSHRIFVAGATGVVGRRSVDALVRADHRVVANVRDQDAQRLVTELGATAVTVDLFDEAAVDAAVEECDVVVNLATSIPTGVRAARPSAWHLNDRLRIDAAANLAQAAGCRSARYIGESVTFPYVDCGDELVDEAVECTYFSGNESTQDAERSAHSVTEAGGVGVVLRFAMFFAEDSGHTIDLRRLAARGVFGVPGRADAYMAWLHADDAARAVVAALDVPAGVYNVAESAPRRRVEHREALERSLGRRVRALPNVVVAAGGKALGSMARSQRISSDSLMSRSSWEPQHSILAEW